MKLKKVRIPGKVMLSGEYAVLFGAMAVLMPVPLYLEIAETANPPERAYPKVVDVALKHPIIQVEKYEKKYGIPNLEIDCHKFFAEDDNTRLTKLGLGCSAAEAVGVVALRYERAGKPYKEYSDDLFKHAVSIHNIAQDGVGSGADVAACAYGKPLMFQIAEGAFQLEAIDMNNPDELMPLHLVWTGQSANTRSMVKQFQTRFDEGDNKALNYLVKLIEASNELAEAWFNSPELELFEIIDEFNAVMQECALMAGIQYKLPIHDQIENWAKRHNGRAKPTGAGGGDMILLVGDLPIDELKQLVIPLKFESLIC